ncbi:unnamed protein product [Soboliphyme baturini]|uniref:Replication protein A 70 kDa DNA-binding subunit n=1 Tax=Soboliphyme baturini TaxID=241478 RepID=A0A183IBY4_9BILA|nr:unnamed protein product [Soboliphyme baturini]
MTPYVAKGSFQWREADGKARHWSVNKTTTKSSQNVYLLDIGKLVEACGGRRPEFTKVGVLNELPPKLATNTIRTEEYSDHSNMDINGEISRRRKAAWASFSDVNVSPLDNELSVPTKK